MHDTHIVRFFHYLTLVRTCYFPILERTWGSCHPHAISPPIEIELWDSDETNPWDVLSPTVPELTSLGHILTPPGRVKVKKDSNCFVECSESLSKQTFMYHLTTIYMRNWSLEESGAKHYTFWFWAL